jgi:hypothetical protein
VTLPFLALVLALASPARAEDSRMTWKNETNELFAVQLPEAWRRKPLSGPDAGYLFTDGLRTISVARRAEQAPGEGEKTAVKVDGKKTERIKRVYRASAGGDDHVSPASWIYEETVVVPEKKGAWAIRFSAPSRKPGPAAIAAWEKFLASFKASAPKAPAK